jgi:putative transposase
MLRDAEAELTAFADFPVAHWKRMWSTHPLERLNKEIKERTESSASSPTSTPCTAWPARSWPRPTTNGRSATATTSPKARWPPSAPLTDTDPTLAAPALLTA